MAPCLKISPPSPSAFTALAISYPYISRPARASTAKRTSEESPAISSLRNLRVNEDSCVTTRLFPPPKLLRSPISHELHNMQECRISNFKISSTAYHRQITTVPDFA